MEKFLSKKILDIPLSSILTVVAVTALSIAFIEIVCALARRIITKSGKSNAGTGFVVSVVKIVLYFIVLCSLCEYVGIPISSIIALLSVVGLAVSLSVQNLLTNLFGGFTILFTKPFRKGDYIAFGEYEGTVSEVGMMYTHMVNYDNQTLLIPNKDVSSSVIVNYTRLGTRRILFTVGFSYDETPEKVREALLEAVKNVDVLSEPKPNVVIEGYSESSVNYTLRVWAEAKNYWNVFYKINENIKNVTDALGVEITYNHLNVHLINSQQK